MEDIQKKKIHDCRNFQQFADYIVEHDLVIKVPDYQRPYAWGKKQVQTLVDDLKECQGDYFLGVFLLDSSQQGVTSVIDGQQRLTTIFILLNCIRKKYSDYWTLFNHEKPYSSTLLLRKNYCRLTLQETINDKYFQALFDCEDSNKIGEVSTNGYQAEETLKEAFEECFRLVEQLDEKRCQKILLTLFTAHLIIYEETNTGMAMRVFELMNDRGKSLTNLEVVKSYSMSLAWNIDSGDKHAWKSINEDFIAINRLIKEISFYESSFTGDEILRYHAIAVCDWKSAEYKEPKDLFKKKLLCDSEDNEKGNKNLQQTINELKDSFEFFKELYTDVFSLKPRYKWFKNLYILGYLANFYPLLLAIRKCFKADEFKEVFNRVCNILELFSFCAYSILHWPSDTAMSRFYSLARDIVREGYNKEKIFNVLSEIIRKYCIEHLADFKRNLLSPNYYNSRRDKVYLLIKYENYLIDQSTSYEPPYYSDLYLIKGKVRKEDEELRKKFATIEHIVAQEIEIPDENKDKYFELLFNSSLDQMTESEQKEYEKDATRCFVDNYMNFIGNLVLSSQGANSSKGNNIPENKDWNGFESQREILRLMTSAEPRGDLEIVGKGHLNIKIDVKLIKQRAKKIEEFVDFYWPLKAFEIVTQDNENEVREAQQLLIQRKELI